MSAETHRWDIRRNVATGLTRH